MKDEQLTQARLRSVFFYDQATGIFTRIIATANAVKPGQIAGNDAGKGYLRMRIDGRTYRAHRLAWLYMTGAWPSDQVDHIDGNRANNAWSNLRDVSGSVNQQNRRVATRRSVSGYLGVRASGSKWVAQIDVAGKTKSLGTYPTPAEAHAAYLAAKRQLHAGCTL